MAYQTYNDKANWRDSCSSTSYRQKRRTGQSQIHWESGHLAFLTSHKIWNEEDHYNLIDSKEIHPKATNHPCVILERFQDSDHCLITPVSAFSASEETSFLPPWKQRCHRYKKAQDFRSFRGSESSSSGSDTDRSNDETCQLLELRNGRTMPKPKASWIYIQHIYVVPVHLLIPFHKPGQRKSEPKQPRQLTDASLCNLLAHIRKSCSVFKQRINKLIQFRRGLQNASSGCKRQDQSQTCSSASSVSLASQHHNKVNQVHPTNKPATNANLGATTTTWARMAVSPSSTPTQGPWRKHPSAPANTLTPKNTPQSFAQQISSQQPKVQLPPMEINHKGRKAVVQAKPAH